MPVCMETMLPGALKTLDVFETREASSVEHGLRALAPRAHLAFLRLQSWLGPVSLTENCMLLLQTCNGKLGLDRNQASLWTPGYPNPYHDDECIDGCLI